MQWNKIFLRVDDLFNTWFLYQVEGVNSRISGEAKADYFTEDLDPEALDYEPEAETDSLERDETIKEVGCSSAAIKKDEISVASIENFNLKEGGEKEELSAVGNNFEPKAISCGDDKELPDNMKELESVKSTKVCGTPVSKENEGIKSQHLIEPIDSNEYRGEAGDLNNLESTTVNEKVAREAAIKAAEESNKDLFDFTRIPVRVREPLRLPRRATDMLSSGRPLSPNDVGVFPDSPIPPQSPPCALSDVSESDSELESLASECSTMTAVSELSMGDEEVGGEAPGKIKRRGMKKKRKDRRRSHGGKCSKEQHRSDMQK